jgi:ABC-2 type transport system permease protein
MEATPAPKPVRINRWLPYWAVFQADVRQTMSSWVYRVWVLVSVLAALGYLLYKVGVYREAKIIQSASELISDLLRWTVLGSVTLIIFLTGASISSERGTMADSVLSRGISRYQYFLGKWHARLVAVLGTYLVLAAVALTAAFLLLHEDLSLFGSLVALGAVAAILATVVTCGVTVSAVSHSSVLAIAVLWVGLYGIGFALSLLPSSYPAPDRVLAGLPAIVRGTFDPTALGRLIGWLAAACGAVALAGLFAFSRRDV